MRTFDPDLLNKERVLYLYIFCVCVCLQSSYSQLLAATCLSKLVSRTSNPLPLEQRIDIRKTHTHKLLLSFSVLSLSRSITPCQIFIMPVRFSEPSLQTVTAQMYTHAIHTQTQYHL